MNLIKTVYPLLKAKLTGKKIPYIMELYLTEKCNMKCKYCYVRPGCVPELNTQGWIDKIDELYNKGMRFVSILGGEPLLRDDFDIIMNHIRNKGIVYNVITNGTMLDKWFDYIVDMGKIIISAPNSYDRNTPEESYMIHAAINQLVIRGVKITFIYTVTKNNYRGMEHFIRYANALNANILFAECIGKYKDSLNIRECHVFWRRIKAIKKYANIIKPDSIIDRMIKLNIGHDVFENSPNGICNHGKYMGIVYPEGRYGLCCNLYGQYRADTWEVLSEINHCNVCRNVMQNTTNEILNLNWNVIKEALKIL